MVSTSVCEKRLQIAPGLARPNPERAADVSAAGVVRVERQCAIHQPHHGADVPAERGLRQGGIRHGARVVAGHFEGPPREIGALPAVRRGIFAPTVKKEPMTAEPGPGECRSVMRVAFDRLVEKAEGLGGR